MSRVEVPSFHIRQTRHSAIGRSAFPHARALDYSPRHAAHSRSFCLPCHCSQHQTGTPCQSCVQGVSVDRASAGGRRFNEEPADHEHAPGPSNVVGWRIWPSVKDGTDRSGSSVFLSIENLTGHSITTMCSTNGGNTQSRRGRRCDIGHKLTVF